MWILTFSYQTTTELVAHQFTPPYQVPRLYLSTLLCSGLIFLRLNLNIDAPVAWWRPSLEHPSILFLKPKRVLWRLILSRLLTTELCQPGTNSRTRLFTKRLGKFGLRSWARCTPRASKTSTMPSTASTVKMPPSPAILTSQNRPMLKLCFKHLPILLPQLNQPLSTQIPNSVWTLTELSPIGSLLPSKLELNLPNPEPVLNNISLSKSISLLLSPLSWFPTRKWTNSSLMEAPLAIWSSLSR